MSSGKKRCGGFKVLFFGAMIGLVIGLLLAPRPGSEIIDMLRGS